MANLIWEATADDEDNSAWEAESALHDGGVHFRYRVTPFVRADAIAWTMDESDAELVGGEKSGVGHGIPELAMVACEAVERGILAALIGGAGP